MKYNEIMPECFIDSTLVASLLDAKVNHKHSSNEVAKAMETFIQANVEAMGMKMEDFDLPSDLAELIEQTKDSLTTQKDARILKLCKALRQSPEVAKLQDVLSYLAANKYDVDIEELKNKIK